MTFSGLLRIAIMTGCVCLVGTSGSFARELELGDTVVIQTSAKPLAGGILEEFITVFPSGTLQQVTAEYVVIEGVRFAVNDVVLLEDAAEFYTKAIEADPKSVDALVGRCTAHFFKDEFAKAMVDCDATLAIDPKRARLHQMQAMILMEMKEFDKASQAIEHAIELDPQDSRAYLCRSVLGEERKDHLKSLEDASKAIELSPGYLGAYLQRTRVSQKLGKFEEAIQDCTFAIRKDYNHARAYATRGETLLREQDSEGALRDAKEAVRLNPKRANSYALLARAEVQEGSLKDSFVHFDKAIELAITSKSAAYCYAMRGIAYGESLDIALGRKDLEKALELDSGFVDALEPLAEFCTLEGNPAGAVEVYHRFLEKNPGNLKALEQRAEELFKQGEHAAAIKDLTEILSANPTHLKALLARGKCYIASKDLVNAAKDLDAAIAVDALDTDVLCQRGLVHLQQKEYDQAIEQFNKATEVNPYNLLALRGRADTWNAKGNTVTEAFDRLQLTAIVSIYHDTLISAGNHSLQQRYLSRALGFFREVLDYDPTNHQAYLGKGQALTIAKLWNLAEQDFNKVIELTPRNFQAFYWRGYVRYRRHDDLSKVLEDFSSAMKFGGDRGLLLQARANIYEKMEDYGHMMEDYRAAKKLAPNDPQVLNNLAWMLATCPSEKQRNGKEAIELATKACEITDWEQWHIIDTLAAAYAEAGDMEKAIEHHKQGVELGGEQAETTAAAERLALYLDNKPYHQSPPKRDANGKLIIPEEEGEKGLPSLPLEDLEE